MTLEETIADVIARQLAPLVESNRRLASEVDRLRRALPPQLVSVTDAARALRVDPRTVRRRVQDGSIPSRRVGRRLLVDLGATLHKPELISDDRNS